METPNGIAALHDGEQTGKNILEHYYEKSPALVRYEFFHPRNDGLYLVDVRNERPSIKVCSFLKVVAGLRNGKSEEWGKLVQIIDPDGVNHEVLIPMSMLAGDGNEVREQLLSLGLQLGDHKYAKELLLRYLRTEIPKARARSVSRIGWHGTAFVLPNCFYGSTDEKVFLQTSMGQDYAFNTSGTLEEWQTHIATKCIGNSRLVTALCAAFAAPLLYLTGDESGGFHFQGDSSIGKTTTLRVAGSVWGGGGVSGYIQRWRATTNGLEAIAEGHCDALLLLDELAQVDQRDAGEVAYMLSNGVGKARASKSGGARKKAEWRTLFLSTGEIGLAEHMRQGGKRAKAGQETRMCDIPAEAGKGLGLFENIHEFPSANVFADHLNEASGKYYGTAIRAFLCELVKIQSGVAAQIEVLRTDFLKSHLPEEANGQAKRVARRFALAAAAGELATELGILPWPEGEAMRSISLCFKAWLEHRGGHENAEAIGAISQVRAFLEAHGESRFTLITDDGLETDGRTTINRAGFRQRTEGGGTLWLILNSVYRDEICRGFDHATVTRALREAGYLKSDAQGKSSISKRLPGLGQTRVYCVSSEIMGGSK